MGVHTNTHFLMCEDTGSWCTHTPAISAIPSSPFISAPQGFPAMFSISRHHGDDVSSDDAAVTFLLKARVRPPITTPPLPKRPQAYTHFPTVRYC